MHGHNQPRRREEGGDLLQVHEVFHTLQGEGPFSGLPAVFIRLTGCNLRCWFCDTVWNDDHDPRMMPEQWANKAREVAGPKTNLAVLTGGEPLRQDLEQLIRALQERGFRDVQVETAGSFWQDCLTMPGVTVVVSPKTSKVRKEFYERIKCAWKYVIRSGEVDPADGLPSHPMQRIGEDRLGGGAPARPPAGVDVYLQPCDEQNEFRNKLNAQEMRSSALRFGYRAGLQVHKYLDLP